MLAGDKFASIRIKLGSYVVIRFHLLQLPSLRPTIETKFIFIIDSKCRNAEMLILATTGVMCYKQGACKCISIIHSLFAISHPFIVIIFVYSYFDLLVSVYDLFKIPLALLILTLRACRLSPQTISTHTHTHTTSPLAAHHQQILIVVLL